MKGTIKEVLQIIGGKCRIVFEVNRIENYEKLQKFVAEKTECSIEIKKWFNRRSLDSNAYAWKLISEITDKLNTTKKLHTTKEQVYFEMLKDYGVSLVVSVKSEEDIEKIKKAFKYYEPFGSGVIGEKQFTHYKIYIGSSGYDVNEMSVFIKGIVQECEQLGIETLTPRELEELNNLSYQETK